MCGGAKGKFLYFTLPGLPDRFPPSHFYMNHFLKENNTSVYIQKAGRILACVQSQLSERDSSLSQQPKLRSSYYFPGVVLNAPHTSPYELSSYERYDKKAEEEGQVTASACW